MHHYFCPVTLVITFIASKTLISTRISISPRLTSDQLHSLEGTVQFLIDSNALASLVQRSAPIVPQAPIKRIEKQN